MAISPELALAAIVVVAVAGLAAVWLIPNWQARRWREAGIDEDRAAELENGARGTIVQLVGGVALILTFVATWAQIADSRRASERTLELAAQQQQSERFSRAIEQLGSSRLANRVAAMAGLDAVIRGPVREDREPAVQVIFAYLRTAHRPGTATYYEDIPSRDCEQPAAEDLGKAPPRPEPDMQAAVAILVAHGGLDRRLHNLSQLDFSALDAEAADFSRASLGGSFLNYANLNGARFSGADLTDARLHRACLRNASFTDASASGVVVMGADLLDADFTKADLSRGNLQSANLQGASFASADLESASLRWARLRGASFEGAELRNADLRNTDVGEEELSSARIDRCTRLPWRREVPVACAYPGSVG